MLVLIMVLGVWKIQDVLGTCPDGCDKRVLVYEDLRCKPIYASETDCCPSQFDCSHIKEDAKIKDKCHFHGKLYSPGQDLNNEELNENCHAGCMCKNNDGKTDITCAILDCPEFIDHNAGPGCHFTYNLGHCCSSGKACPPFNDTCKANDKTYHEGQKFPHPNEKCTSCVCTNDSEFGKCKKVQCAEEITNRKDIENFCAPSYRTDDFCCSWSWICPEESDNILSSNKTNQPKDPKCEFGSRVLNIGDSFVRNDTTFGGTVECTCDIPPLLTCIHTFAPHIFEEGIHPRILKQKLTKKKN